MLMGSPRFESCGNPVRKVFMIIEHKLSTDGPEQMERRRNCIPRDGQCEKCPANKMNRAYLEDFPELEGVKE